jgi:hypothetical protein
LGSSSGARRAMFSFDYLSRSGGISLERAGTRWEEIGQVTRSKVDELVSILRRSYMMDVQKQDVILRGTETRDLGKWQYSRAEMGDSSRPRVSRRSRWRIGQLEWKRGGLSNLDLGLDIALVFPEGQN